MIEPVARLRIELRDLEPKIWRRVDVPLSSTLAALNDIIQVSFDWQDCHSYEFVVGERVYDVPTDDDALCDRKTFKAASIRLKTVIERGVDRFLYVYDFGDDWRHGATTYSSKSCAMATRRRNRSARYHGSCGSSASCRLPLAGDRKRWPRPLPGRAPPARCWSASRFCWSSGAGGRRGVERGECGATWVGEGRWGGRIPHEPVASATHG